MKLLLDTHAVIWWFEGNTSLPQMARDAIAESEADVFVSAASAFEIATKYRIGKLPHARALAEGFLALIDGQGFRALPISARHAQNAGLLAFAHKDPFDRLLIAQAQVESLTLVSNERLFDSFGVSRLW